MKTEVKITDLTTEDLVNLFSTAFYGSSYLSANYDEDKYDDVGDCYEEVMARILLDGGAIKVTDSYADGCHYGKLRWEFNEDYDAIYHVRFIDILQGLERAANGTFNAGENDQYSPDWRERNIRSAQLSFHSFAYDDTEWDAVRADILMQIILFDEIIYG